MGFRSLQILQGCCLMRLIIAMTNDGFMFFCLIATHSQLLWCKVPFTLSLRDNFFIAHTADTCVDDVPAISMWFIFIIEVNIAYLGLYQPTLWISYKTEDYRPLFNAKTVCMPLGKEHMIMGVAEKETKGNEKL